MRIIYIIGLMKIWKKFMNQNLYFYINYNDKFLKFNSFFSLSKDMFINNLFFIKLYYFVSIFIKNQNKNIKHIF